MKIGYTNPMNLEGAITNLEYKSDDKFIQRLSELS